MAEARQDIGARAVIAANEARDAARPFRWPPHPEGTRRWKIVAGIVYCAIILFFLGHLATLYRDYAVTVAVTKVHGDVLRARCAMDPPTEPLSDWGRTCIAAASQAAYPYRTRQRRAADAEAISQ